MVNEILLYSCENRGLKVYFLHFSEGVISYQCNFFRFHLTFKIILATLQNQLENLMRSYRRGKS